MNANPTTTNSSTTPTTGVDLRSGASAAAAVLALPAVPLAFLYIVDTVSGLRIDTAVETSGTGWNFEASREAIELVIGWPTWVALAALAFIWRTGMLRAAATKLGWRAGIPRNEGPFRQFGAVDRMRLALFVERVDRALQLRIPNRTRKQIRQELEVNLAESATVEGTGPALAKLGSVRSLVRGYLDASPRRLDIAAGATHAAAGIAALFVIAMLMSAAFVEGWQAGGSAAAAEQWFGFFLVEVAPNRIGFQLDIPVMLTVALVAFVTGSKPWRLLRDAPHS